MRGMKCWTNGDNEGSLLVGGARFSSVTWFNFVGCIRVRSNGLLAA